jgi:uncharacterized protein YceK
MTMKRLVLAIAVSMLALSGCTASVTTYDGPGYYDSRGYWHYY